MKKTIYIMFINSIVLLMLTFIGLLQAIINEEKYVLFIAFLMLYLFNLLLLFIIFSKYTNKYPLNEMKENIIKRTDLREEKLDIIVIQENNVFVITINNRKYQIDLQDYIFKKNYIVALISRNFRYIEVSGRKPLKYLFCRKLKSSNLKSLKECNIMFFNQSKLIKRVNLVKEKVIHHSYLVNEINKSRYWLYFLLNRCKAQAINKDIHIINEEIYQKKELIEKN